MFSPPTMPVVAGEEVHSVGGTECTMGGDEFIERVDPFSRLLQ